METQPALIGSDGRVHLDSESAVDFNLSFVIDPRNTEHDHAFGFGNALKDLRMLVLGVFLNKRNDRFCHFVYGLVKLGLGSVLGLDHGHELFNFGIHI